jgi:hypothetical protein
MGSYTSAQRAAAVAALDVAFAEIVVTDANDLCGPRLR